MHRERELPAVRLGTADVALWDQHRCGLARRPPVPAMGGAAGEIPDGAKLERRSARPLSAGYVCASLRLAAYAEVRAGARPSHDDLRAERQLSPGLHRRAAAAGRPATI